MPYSAGPSYLLSALMSSLSLLRSSSESGSPKPLFSVFTAFELLLVALTAVVMALFRSTELTSPTGP